jgi:hypothetical protein
MKFAQILIACAFAAPQAMALGSPDITLEPLVIERGSSWSLGGFVSTYAKKAQRSINSGQRIEIRTRTCISACTYFALSPYACALPDTSFKFHAPQHFVFAFAGIPGIVHKPSLKVMVDDFNMMRPAILPGYPALGDWFLERAGNLTGPFFRVLSGAEMNRVYGLDLCDEVARL